MKEWKPEALRARLDKCDFAELAERLRQGEYDFEALEFSGGEAGTVDFSGATFTRCVFRRCRFSRAELAQCGFVDSILEGCDFSNAALGESLWRRCELTDCRLVGAKLGEARFRQVRLRGCAAEFADFDRASFQSVRFADCNLQEAWFSSCKCKELEADGCSFLKTNFYRTPLAGVDFTTSEIGGWTLSESAPELRGAVVTPLQAVELAERLGLVVKSEPDGDAARPRR